MSCRKSKLYQRINYFSNITVICWINRTVVKSECAQLSVNSMKWLVVYSAVILQGTYEIWAFFCREARLVQSHWEWVCRRCSVGLSQLQNCWIPWPNCQREGDLKMFFSCVFPGSCQPCSKKRPCLQSHCHWGKYNVSLPACGTQKVLNSDRFYMESQLQKKLLLEFRQS